MKRINNLKVIVVILWGIMAYTEFAEAQTAQTRADGVAVSEILSNRTGVPTVVTIHPSKEFGYGYEINVRFLGEVYNYKGVMGALIGAVGESTRQSVYKTHYCYISCSNRKSERILTTYIRKAQRLALAGDYDESWRVFWLNKGETTVPSW